MKWSKASWVCGIILCAGVLSARAEPIRIEILSSTVPVSVYRDLAKKYSESHPEVSLSFRYVNPVELRRILALERNAFVAADRSVEEDEKKPKFHYFPAFAWATVPVVNLPGLAGDVELDMETLRLLCLQDIRNWDHPLLPFQNQNIKHPIRPIWITRESDLTWSWTDGLSEDNERFMKVLGPVTRSDVLWEFKCPDVGKVVQEMRNAPGTFGYVDLETAKKHHLMQVHVENKKAEFVRASPEAISTSLKCATEKEGKAWSFPVRITNQDCAGAYPFSNLSYLVISKEADKVADKTTVLAVIDFVEWVNGDGQTFIPKDAYAPLTETVRKRAKEELFALRKRITEKN